MSIRETEATLEELLAENKRLKEELSQIKEQICPIYSNEKGICNSLISDSFSPFLIVNLESGIIVHLNKKAEELFGLPKVRICGIQFSELHKSLNSEPVDLSVLLNSDTPFNRTIITSSGLSHHVSMTGKALHSVTTPLILLQYNNVTASQEEKNDLRTLFDLSLDIICIADINKEVFELVNPAFSRILGYPLDEVEGKPYLDFLHPDDIVPTAAVVEKQLKAGKEVVNFQNRHRCKNGEYRWLQWFTHPVPEKGKNYAVARDITESRLIEEKLRVSEERYSALYDAMREGLAIHDMILDTRGKAVDYEITEVNKQYEKILGIPRSKAIGTRSKDLYGVDDPPYMKEYAEVVRTGVPTSFEVYFPPLDKYFHISVIRVKENSFATIFEDLTDFLNTQGQLKKSLRELSETKSLLTTVFEQAPVPMAVVNTDLTLDVISLAARRIFNVPEDYPLEGQNVHNMLRTWEAYDSSGKKMLKEQIPFILGLQEDAAGGDEIQIIHSDGTRHWVEVKSSPIYNERKEIAAAFSSFQEITTRKNMELELRRLATTDPLTGANNRRYFNEQCEKEFSKARRYNTPMTLLSLDIDHFKSINDKYGHHSGDLVLKDLVHLCKDIFRETDIFARMGGEEFNSLMIHTDLFAAEKVAERLRKSVLELVCRTEGADIQFTVSIGLSDFRAEDDSMEDIMHRADKALYNAKDKGRNRIEVQ